ncbi:capsid assembly protein [Campylobacter concisus]|uniref:capsid assembly protein n=1 Tax=Campylobacter concisus TaxID=199 RepID=UPI000CD82AFF|nr:hypothetical protein [Campylobacter concisus]
MDGSNIDNQMAVNDEIDAQPSKTEIPTQTANTKTTDSGQDASLKITADKPQDTPKQTYDPSKDFDYSRYENELRSTGDIGEASRNELYKTFPKNLVDNYIENLKVASAYVTEQAANQAYNLVGGKEDYNAMIAWASENLTEDEIEDYNEAINSGNQRRMNTAIKGLYARKSLASSNKPKLTMGDTSGGKLRDDTFLTRRDYANAIADERYSKSPQYRAEVDERLANTLKLGGFRQ